jgi:RNA polymerase sigma-70 factor (ECF subfamily)
MEYIEPQNRDDKEIIQEIKQGKEAAMDELIKKYQKRVYNTLYGMCMDYDTAWDVSQEAFVKVVQNINNFRGDSSFWTFLYRVTMNAFYDHKRKEKVRGRVGNFSDYEDDSGERKFDVKDAVNIEVDFEKKQMQEKMKTALSSLTNTQKEVFVLKTTEGLKIREIAGMLGISEGTVKSHLNRSTEKIKKALGGEAL